jgi:enterochelin esterase family protein
MTQAGRLPPLRAVLLDPLDRNEHYSVCPAYARALAAEVLPALAWLAPNGRHSVVGMGASLGALAMLHVHRSRPSAFAGLFLQSSSFFRQRYDRQESGCPRFRRITRFVGEVLNASSAARPIPVTLTCGAVEENLANNRAVSRALRRQGYEARLLVNRDAHNYVAWRDTFDPNLVDLLARVWR